MSNHYRSSGPEVLLSRFIFKYKIDIKESDGKKQLCRYKVTENWHILAELKPDSFVAKELSLIPSEILKQAIFTQVTKEELKNNDLAMKLPNFEPSKEKCFYAEISGKTYAIFERDLKKQILRTLKESKTELFHSYELKEIPVSLIETKRRNKIPGFILKDNGKYYYTEIPSNIGFSPEITFGHHMCSFGNGNNDCKRLSAETDARGGCAKVRDIYKRLENYPFIISGFETVNTRQRSFVVLKCNHYEKRPPREPLSIAEINKIKLGLANLFFDGDIESLAEVRKRKAKNRTNFD